MQDYADIAQGLYVARENGVPWKILVRQYGRCRTRLYEIYVQYHGNPVRLAHGRRRGAPAGEHKAACAAGARHAEMAHMRDIAGVRHSGAAGNGMDGGG